MRIRIKESRSALAQTAGRATPSRRENHPEAAADKKSALPSGLPWPIAMVPVARLKRAERNPRTHPKKQIEQIVNSMRQFGYVDPVLADENLQIIGGHARAEAAERAGFRTIPVIVISGLSEIKKRALALADNKIAENAGWHRSELASELSELGPLIADAGLDIELTGFEPAEIDSLMGVLIDPERDPLDELPEIASEPVSRREDMWLLGQHRLLCGDATNSEDVRTLMGQERAAMVFADPPYNVKIPQSARSRPDQTPRIRAGFWGDVARPVHEISCQRALTRGQALYGRLAPFRVHRLASHPRTAGRGRTGLPRDEECCCLGEKTRLPACLRVHTLRLGGLAQFGRELIRARADDARKRAKARGVRFGWPLVAAL